MTFLQSIIFLGLGVIALHKGQTMDGLWLLILFAVCGVANDIMTIYAKGTKGDKE